MALFDYSHKKAILFGLTTVILLLLFPALFAVVFPASNEVSYDAGIGFSTCNDFYLDDDDDPAMCTSQYNIIVGNTGKVTQEYIAITIDGMPGSPRIGWSAQDIVASSVRPTPALITEERNNLQRVLTIEHLAPNRLVEFRFQIRGMAARQQLENIEVTVNATGHLIHSNPTLTVISRFAKNIFGVFGI